MTPEQRKAARERCEKATPGPWEDDGWDNFGPDFDPVRSVGPLDPDAGKVDVDQTVCHVLTWDQEPRSWEDAECSRCKANTLFIAHARTDLPAALDYIDQLEAQIAQLKAQLFEARQMVGVTLQAAAGIQGLSPRR